MDVGTISMKTCRKENKNCCECRGKIYKGSKYECATGSWEGDWTTFNTCEACAKLREEVCNLPSVRGVNEDDLPAYGHLYDWLACEDIEVEDGVLTDVRGVAK